MRRSPRWLEPLFAVTLFACTGCGGSSAPSGDAQRAMAAIEAGGIRGHMTFLADDLLEGRATGTRGYDLAANYVASQFEAAGLEPGGTEGWFQPVPFRRSELLHARSSVTLARDGHEARLAYGDFTMSGDALRAQSAVSAPVVFVGHGVTAPEYEHDDYRDVDVRGKIVAMVRGAPARFSNDERAYYSWSYMKAKTAVEHGAIGIIQIRTRRDDQMARWERSVRQSKLPRFEWLDPGGEPHHVFPEILGQVTLSRPSVVRLFEGAAANLDSVLDRCETGRSVSFPLPTSARIESRSKLADAASPNVIGVLRGSDPSLAGEFVVYSGHLDHIGISEPVDGDSINNGAFDNASGIAAMIEVARAFKRLGTSPRRSILFLATTGEEKGLLGAEYYTEHPTVPVADIVANLNLDMFVMAYPVADLVAFGAEHSSLGPMLADPATRNRFEVSPDPEPEEVVFIRSDQFPFVRKGVPALFITAGNKSHDPAANGKEIEEEWRKNRYHAPADDLQQPIDYDSGARFARVNFLLGWNVAQADARPQWNADDYFGKKFGPDRVATQ